MFSRDACACLCVLLATFHGASATRPELKALEVDQMHNDSLSHTSWCRQPTKPQPPCKIGVQVHKVRKPVDAYDVPACKVMKHAYESDVCPVGIQAFCLGPEFTQICCCSSDTSVAKATSMSGLFNRKKQITADCNNQAYQHGVQVYNTELEKYERCLKEDECRQKLAGNTRQEEGVACLTGHGGVGLWAKKMLLPIEASYCCPPGTKDSDDEDGYLRQQCHQAALCRKEGQEMCPLTSEGGMAYCKRLAGARPSEVMECQASTKDCLSLNL